MKMLLAVMVFCTGLMGCGQDPSDAPPTPYLKGDFGGFPGVNEHHAGVSLVHDMGDFKVAHLTINEDKDATTEGGQALTMMTFEKKYPEEYAPGTYVFQYDAFMNPDPGLRSAVCVRSGVQDQGLDEYYFDRTADSVEMNVSDTKFGRQLTFKTKLFYESEPEYTYSGFLL